MKGMHKASYILIPVFCLLVFSPLLAADFNQFYTPFVKPGDVLFEESLYYFGLAEEGVHGSAAYEDFTSEPSYFSLNTLFRFSLLNKLECTFATRQAIPAQYSRYTYLPAGNLGVIQDYHIDYFSDYSLDLRYRMEPIEAYVSIQEKTQKDDWRSASYPDDPNFFSYIRAHFEDFKAGLRYLSGPAAKGQDTNMSLLDRPLLDQHQLAADLQLGYKKGALRRNTYFYSGASTLPYNFYHRLDPQYIPASTVTYGIDKNLEIESGLSFISPAKYHFEFKRFFAGTTSLTGAYKLDRNFEVPLSLRYRMGDDLEMHFSSDLRFCRQRLDYSSKSNAGVVTAYPDKELDYFNTRPSLELTYLYDNNKKIQEDNFSSVTQNLLAKGQFLLKMSYEKDITSLDKNDANGPQNIIDPYGAFLYPLDYFVGGTELASFFTGNTSNSACDTLAQKYYATQFNFKYGLTDRFNAGFRIGYRSSSRLHHYTLGNITTAPTPYDLKTRYYTFKPYYYFGFVSEWRPGKNILLSLGWNFVPEYSTTMKIQGYSQEFKSKTKYNNIWLTVKILF
jgi:hypothetical protein